MMDAIAIFGMGLCVGAIVGLVYATKKIYSIEKSDGE